MSVALRPVLRPSHLSGSSISSPSTTYICQSCRHARLLRRPKRPYTFTQLVTLSDGSAFTMRTTSPAPVYRSTRDTRNAPLWNPSSKELLNVEDDEAGRLAGFRARFGKSFDASKEAAVTSGQSKEPETSPKKEEKKEEDLFDFGYQFEDDDASILDMISSYGQRPGSQQSKKNKPK